MSSQLQSGLTSLLKKGNLASGITLQGARIRPLKIKGGKLLNPRIRIRLMQTALKNSLGQTY